MGVTDTDHSSNHALIMWISTLPSSILSSRIAGVFHLTEAPPPLHSLKAGNWLSRQGGPYHRQDHRDCPDGIFFIEEGRRCHEYYPS